MAVHQHIARAIGAAQQRVIALFHARTPHHIAWLVIGISGLVQHVLTDLAGVTNQGRGKTIARIKPALLIDRLQLRKLIAMRLDELFLIRRDVGLERNKLILWAAAVLHQDGLNLIDGHVQPARDLRQVGLHVLRLILHQKARNRWIVVHQQTPLAIEEPAAWRQDRNLADAIGLRKLAPVAGAENLQSPKSGNEHGEDRDDDVLHHRQLERRNLLVPHSAHACFTSLLSLHFIALTPQPSAP